jgi:hypothetical protein
MEKKIQEYYLDPKFGLIGLDTFVTKFRKIYPKTSAKEVKRAVQKLDSFSLHKETRHGLIKRRQYLVPSENDLWSLDICFLPKLKRYNDGISAHLIATDAFSKLTRIESLRSKSSSDTAKAFEKILLEIQPERILKVLTDQGTEFTGGPFKRLLKRYEIKHFHALASPHKSCFSELRCKYFKARVYRWLTSRNTSRYIHIVKDIEYNLNNTVTRSHGFKPSEINRLNSHIAFKRMYGDYFREVEAYAKRLKAKEKKKDSDAVLKVGTKVRISVQKGRFEGGYSKRWKSEFFWIHRVKRSYPVTYYVIDSQGEVIRGAFYRQELQPVLEKGEESIPE